MTTADLILYYQNLLEAQYNAKPKAQGTISVLVSQTIGNQIVQQVQQGFNLSTAVGAQLDILGTYRGISRNVYGFNPSMGYFTIPSIGDSNAGSYPGFNRIGEVPLETTWAQISDANGVLYTMTDDEFRETLEFAAALAVCDFGMESIDAILFDYFGGNVLLIDGENMTATYAALPGNTGNLFSIASLLGLFPHPTGVRLTFLQAPSTPPWFGFQTIPTPSGSVGFSRLGAITVGGFIRTP